MDYSKKNVKFGLLLKIWVFPETEDTMRINNQIVLDRDTECAVIGYGSWATAIVKVLCENENTVHWNIRNPDIIESVTKYGYNCKYVRDAELDRSRLHVSPDINEVIEKAGIVFLAMPSAFIKIFLEDLQVSLDDKFIVSAIKGIVQGDYKTPTEYMHDKYIIPFKRMGVITGPTHAEEVSARKLSYLTIVCSDDRNGEIIGKKLSTPYMHLTFSDDIYGAEYASILKNIYAIAVGISVGLGYGDNFRAVLISNCSREMREFLNVSYPYTRDTNISAYLGDLFVTCYSTLSRNRRLGLLIGKGCSVKSALNEMTMIAEGYFASDCIRHINLRHKAFMPIADTVHDILYNGKSARKAMASLEKYLE